MNITLVDFPEQFAITAQTRGPYEASAPKAWVQLNSWLNQRDTDLTGQRIGYGLDNPQVTDPDELRYVAAITTSDKNTDLNGTGLRYETIEGGRCARLELTGPYSQIGPAIQRLLTEWLPASGHEYDCTRHVIEHYINDPAAVTEAEYRTDILIPIKSAA